MKYQLFRFGNFGEVNNKNFMDTGIILDWNTIESRTFYVQKRAAHPIYYASAQQSWIIYAYSLAKEALQHQDALIPELQTSHTGLNQNAIQLIQQLARLNNFQQHQQSRAVALQLYNQM
ncbi:hypothetical protein [Pedobacter cryoconitis]|nr:hypothetical protein [Pedobacter cryoconitis]